MNNYTYYTQVIQKGTGITGGNGEYNYSPYFFVLTFVQLGSNLMEIIREYTNTMYTSISRVKRRRLL